MGEYCGLIKTAEDGKSTKNRKIISKRSTSKGGTCDDCCSAIAYGDTVYKWFIDGQVKYCVCESCYDLYISLQEAKHKPFIARACACNKEIIASKEAIEKCRIHVQHKDRVCETCKNFIGVHSFCSLKIDCELKPILIDGVDVVTGSTNINNAALKGFKSLPVAEVLVCGFWEKADE